MGGGGVWELESIKQGRDMGGDERAVKVVLGKRQEGGRARTRGEGRLGNRSSGRLCDKSIYCSMLPQWCRIVLFTSANWAKAFTNLTVVVSTGISTGSEILQSLC